MHCHTERQRANQLRAQWRDYQRAPDAQPDHPALPVGLAASFTVEPLEPFAGAALLSAGLRPTFQIAPYNQLFQVCLNPLQAFAGATPQVIVLLWRIEEVLGREWEALASGQTDALDKARRGLDEFAAAIKGLRGRFDGTLVVSTPPFPRTTGLPLDDLRSAATGGAFHRELTRQWCEAIGEIAGTTLLDLDALQRQYGADRADDARKWYLYKQPYTDGFLMRVADTLGRIIRTKLGPPRKCVVLDCDNTLWGGVVGEDGVAGIALGDEFPGKAYRDFQQLLLHYHRQGVLLALNSKNNEADVWEVFEKHDGMVLQREHIAAWRINWQPKAANIREIAADLNIGTDSLVFVDDAGIEIEQVRIMCPEVTCVHLPEEPADIVGHVAGLHLFDRLEVSEEDRQRSAMMAQERQRQVLREQMSPEEFLASLELVVDAFEVTDEHLARVTQLINKTNQFNLTTRRRSQEEVQALLAGDTHRVFAARVADRFGDYGLTGVAVAAIEGTAWHLDTYLLSCRVLGRGVETAFLRYIAAQAMAAGATELRARYLPTAKNAPIADLLPRHGFTETPGGTWHIAVGDLANTEDASSPTAKEAADARRRPVLL